MIYKLRFSNVNNWCKWYILHFRYILLRHFSWYRRYCIDSISTLSLFCMNVVYIYILYRYSINIDSRKTATASLETLHICILHIYTLFRYWRYRIDIILKFLKLLFISLHKSRILVPFVLIWTISYRYRFAYIKYNTYYEEQY